MNCTCVLFIVPLNARSDSTSRHTPGYDRRMDEHEQCPPIPAFARWLPNVLALAALAIIYTAIVASITVMLFVISPTTTMAAVGSLTIFAIVRLQNRRSDPRHAKRPADAP